MASILQQTTKLLALLIILLFTTPKTFSGTEEFINKICTSSKIRNFCIAVYHEIAPVQYEANITVLNEIIVEKSFGNSSNTQLYIIELLGKVIAEEQKQALSACVEAYLNINKYYHNALEYLQKGDINNMYKQELLAPLAQANCRASFDATLMVNNAYMEDLIAISLAAACILQGG